MIEFAVGEQKELNAALSPSGPQIELYPYFVTHQGWPDVQHADVRVYLDLTNNGSSPVILTCTSYLWPELMKDHPPAKDTKTFTIEAGATYKYREEYSSNYGWLVDSWIEVEMPDGQILTLPTITSVAGYTLTSSDPPELVATQVGPDYAVLRFAQRSSCSIWRFRVNTASEPRISWQCWSEESNRSIYAYIGNLLSARTYEADCEGYSPGGAHRSAETQFTTL